MKDYQQHILFGSAILVAAITLLFWSCEHNPFPIPGPPVMVNPDVDFEGNSINCNYVGVCFESSVLPIFVSACAKSGCHDAITHESEFILNSYDRIIRKGIVPGNANESKLYKVTNETGGDRMPPYPDLPLTLAQKDSIAKWINEGAKNTTKCNCACDTTQFTYQIAIAPLLSNFCVGCHSPSSLGGNIDLSTYASVKTAINNGRMIGSISHEPGFSAMPKGGKLSDCQITQVKKWVAAGALNN